MFEALRKAVQFLSKNCAAVVVAFLRLVLLLLPLHLVFHLVQLHGQCWLPTQILSTEKTRPQTRELKKEKQLEH